MNNLYEVKEQCRFDCFVKMYGYIAQAMMEIGGNRGERAVRDAVIRYGEEFGEQLREELLEQGVQTNLRSMLRAECCCGSDPRFFRTVIRDEKESQMFEVYSCPMETVWRKKGCQAAGAIYCEEWIHAAIRAFTQGKGQANLSNYLTCKRDSFCRFSLYLRPANLDEAQRQECFGEDRTEGEGLMEKEGGIASYFLSLYRCLFHSAKEYLGLDGQAAVLVGLDRLCSDEAEALRLEADHTGENLTFEFIQQYFPLPLGRKEECGGDAVSALSGEEERLVALHLTEGLLRKLNLSCEKKEVRKEKRGS